MRTDSSIPRRPARACSSFRTWGARNGPPYFLSEGATPPRTPRPTLGPPRPSRGGPRYPLTLSRLQVQSREDGATLGNLVEAFEGQVEHGPRRHEHHRKVDGGGGDVKGRQREVLEQPVAGGVQPL